MEAIRPWKEIIDAKGSSVVGVSKVVLDKRPCNVRECNLGNFMGDALVHHHISQAQGTDEWKGTIVGLVPAGAIRTTINKGGTYSLLSHLLVELLINTDANWEHFRWKPLEITYNDLAITVPFENSIDTWEMKGEHMLQMFEHAVKTHSMQSKLLLQVSGMAYSSSRQFFFKQRKFF